MVKLLQSGCFIATADCAFIRKAPELIPTGVNVLAEGSNPVAEYVLIQKLSYILIKSSWSLIYLIVLYLFTDFKDTQDELGPRALV